jgi:hypothetical protein
LHECRGRSLSTFGGTKSKPTVFTVTPTPSKTAFEFVFTPVGTFSVFGFKTPIPYPFGIERTGYLVTDMDSAVRSAKAHEADIVVAPFKDPIGGSPGHAADRQDQVSHDLVKERSLVAVHWKSFEYLYGLCDAE